MMKADNPLESRTYVWRGWTRLYEKIVAFGVPYPHAEGTLVPVQYASGEYGVLFGRRMSLVGREFTYARELRAFKNDDCTAAIRHSCGMPEVLSLMSDSYKIGVTDGSVDAAVYLCRRKDALVNEQVVVLPV